jgi:hypothetical protein
MLIRSIVTLLALLFSACLLPVYGQGLGLNLPSNVPLQYTPLPVPCRAVDTRVLSQNYPNGPIAGGTTEQIWFNGCNIQYQNFGFIVYAMNVTVIPHGPLGYLTIWPFTYPQPVVSTLNSEDGSVKANAALVQGGPTYSHYNPETVIGSGGSFYVYASDTTDLVLDVTGYFTVNAQANVYVPVTPCRAVDTRYSNGTFGSPALVGGQSRYFLLADSPCDLPADMTAVSMNVTAVPIGGEGVGYLTVWGTPSDGSTQPPPTSNLNADTGAVTANAAIVTINQGTYGSVSAYASDNTNLVMDVTGYFVPAASTPTGLSLVPLNPCRVLDTRLANGDFQDELTVPITSGNSCNVPSAPAYVTNATVVPAGGLGFLTLWPDGTPQPTVSTLNADAGLVTSNMAIVGSTDGSIDAYASNPTQLIVDLNDDFVEVPFASGSQPTVVFVGDQILQGEVQYANNPNWTFNPVISGYEGSAGADQTAASFSNVLLMNPRPNIVVLQDGNIDGDIDGGFEFGCGPSVAYFGLCADWNVMLSEATAAGIQVIMGNLLPYGPATGSPAVDTEIATINKSIPGILNYYPQTVLLDFNTALGNGSGNYNPLYSNDGTLPNAAGYAVMTTMIQAAINSGVPEAKEGRKQSQTDCMVLSLPSIKTSGMTTPNPSSKLSVNCGMLPR